MNFASRRRTRTGRVSINERESHAPIMLAAARIAMAAAKYAPNFLFHESPPGEELCFEGALRWLK